MCSPHGLQYKIKGEINQNSENSNGGLFLLYTALKMILSLQKDRSFTRS
jgi:hypothetical protein